MFKAVAGRDPLGIPVGAYRNLGTNDPARAWSFRALAGPDKGKKVAEGDSATIVGCTPYVRTATRDRIAAAAACPGDSKGSRGHREVHAWIVGVLVPDGVVPVSDSDRAVTYNPYRRADFHYADTGATFTGCHAVTVNTDGRAYAVTYQSGK